MELYTQHIFDYLVVTALTTTFGFVAMTALRMLMTFLTVGSKQREAASKIPPGPRGWPIVGTSLMLFICLLLLESDMKARLIPFIDALSRACP